MPLDFDVSRVMCFPEFPNRHLVISFPSGSSQCGANKEERNNPRRYAMIKDYN
jgi:hypothetical protein